MSLTLVAPSDAGPKTGTKDAKKKEQKSIITTDYLSAATKGP
jgi:hypothetical protein